LQIDSTNSALANTFCHSKSPLNPSCTPAVKLCPSKEPPWNCHYHHNSRGFPPKQTPLPRSLIAPPQTHVPVPQDIHQPPALCLIATLQHSLTTFIILGHHHAQNITPLVSSFTPLVTLLTATSSPKERGKNLPCPRRLPSPSPETPLAVVVAPAVVAVAQQVPTSCVLRQAMPFTVPCMRHQP